MPPSCTTCVYDTGTTIYLSAEPTNNSVPLAAALHAFMTVPVLQTYIGPILIAVNPYKALPIFSPASVEMYFGRPAGEVRTPPMLKRATIRGDRLASR